MLDKIFFFNFGAAGAGSPALLFAVSAYWQALDISAVANGNYYVFFGNEVFYF
jgi:hypothetical protein